MWGVAGQVDLGISLEVPPKQHHTLLSYLNALPEASGIVKIEGTGQALVMWFRGPRAFGDFLLKWCTTDHPFKEVNVHTLKPGQTYIAIVPDDILAVQELHMASEGMDTESICSNCREPGVQPISTTALKQVRGNPKRAVRFFCSKCRCVCDDVELAPLSPCPIPWNVWKDMRKIQKDLAPLICRHVEFDTLEAACGTGRALAATVFRVSFTNMVPSCSSNCFARQSTRTLEVPNQQSMPMNGKEQYVVSLQKCQLHYG
jgi:hypothetical protein